MYRSHHCHSAGSLEGLGFSAHGSATKASEDMSRRMDAGCKANGDLRRGPSTGLPHHRLWVGAGGLPRDTGNQRWAVACQGK